MADESSRIELILQNSFDTCVLPQEAMCDLGFVVAKALSEYLLLIVALGFYPLLIEYQGKISWLLCIDSPEPNLLLKRQSRTSPSCNRF